jgi:hypothetical protein
MVEKRAPRKPVKGEVRGYLCVNKLMNNAIGKVLTKARQRDMANAKRKADPIGTIVKNQKAQAKFYKDHKEQVLKWNREQRAAKYDDYLKRTRIRRKTRRLTDAEYVIKDRLRARFRSALLRKGASKPGTTERLVGCDAKTLNERLQFDAGKEIDHIFPFEWYDLHSAEDCARVMHYTNLVQLTSKENEDKASKLPTKAMAAKVQRDKWPTGITEDDLPDIYDGWATPLRMH